MEESRGGAEGEGDALRGMAGQLVRVDEVTIEIERIALQLHDASPILAAGTAPKGSNGSLLMRAQPPPPPALLRRWQLNHRPTLVQ